MPTLATSQIVGVTVYARGARVTRRLELCQLEEDAEIWVVGLTPMLVPGSLRAVVPAGVRLGSLTSRLEVPTRESLEAETAARHQTLSRQHRKLSQRHQDLLARQTQLAEIAFEPNFNQLADSRMQNCLAGIDLMDELGEQLDHEIVALEQQMEPLAVQLRDCERDLAATASPEQLRPTTAVVLQLQGSGPIDGLEFSYQVDGARWWPTYTLRMEPLAGRTEWIQEAQVAQNSDEDWRRVPLQLSTASILGDRRLPQLTSIRLGKAQPAAPSGFRPPPAGLDRMFFHYQAFAGDSELEPFVPMPVAEPQPLVQAPAPPMMSPMMGRRPAGSAKLGSSVSAEISDMLAPRGGGSGSMVMKKPQPAPEPVGGEPDDGWLDFDQLILQEPQAPRRGRLARVGPDAWSTRRSESSIQLQSLPGPANSVNRPTEFDYQYRTAGLAEVPGDGALHRVRIGIAEAPLQLVWRCAPGEDAHVYREALTQNPFGRALLPGALDVYVDNSLVQSSTLEAVGAGGETRVGLGIEQRIRVARNARSEEEKGGLIGQLTAVSTAVDIELASSLRDPVTVEVFDRIPISSDNTVKINLLSSTPAHGEYDQADRGRPIKGALRWSVMVSPEKTARIELRYKVTFPAKQEIV